MPIGILIFLLIGIGVMLIPIGLQCWWKKLPWWKAVLVSLILLATGTAGIYLWFFVENGLWGGRSFYGAVFLVPLVAIITARWLKLSYGKLTDISAPAGCAMLALMKYKCWIDDCCNGRFLYFDQNDLAVYFPSQLAELTVALILMVVLLMLSRRKAQSGAVYGWFFLLYGMTRFFLTFMRTSRPVFLLQLPAGSFWSLIAVAVGIAWLIVAKILRKKQI